MRTMTSCFRSFNPLSSMQTSVLYREKAVALVCRAFWLVLLEPMFQWNTARGGVLVYKGHYLYLIILDDVGVFMLNFPIGTAAVIDI